MWKKLYWARLLSHTHAGSGTLGDGAGESISLSSALLGSGAKLESSLLITDFPFGASFFPQSSKSSSLSQTLYFTAAEKKQKGLSLNFFFGGGGGGGVLYKSLPHNRSVIKLEVDWDTRGGNQEMSFICVVTQNTKTSLECSHLVSRPGEGKCLKTTICWLCRVYEQADSWGGGFTYDEKCHNALVWALIDEGDSGQTHL